MDMYKFLKNNEDKYCFYHDKWGITSHQTATYSNGQVYQKPIYGKITTPTKYETNRLFLSIDDGTGKQQDLSAVTMTINDNSDCDTGYIGGTKTVYSFYMPICTYSCEQQKVMNKIIRFIGKIPKKSRNKLIKALYLYDIKEEKDFFSYERLFYRLSKRMGLSFGKRWDNNEISFDRIGPTYSVIGDRNRKLNKLFRNRRWHT
jgi:hypothetical protein